MQALACPSCQNAPNYLFRKELWPITQVVYPKPARIPKKTEDSAPLGTNMGQAPCPDLQFIVDAWTTLPAALRAAVLAVVRSKPTG